MVAYGNTPRGPVEADDHNHDKDEAPVTPNLTPCSSREATRASWRFYLSAKLLTRSASELGPARLPTSLRSGLDRISSSWRLTT